MYDDGVCVCDFVRLCHVQARDALEEALKSMGRAKMKDVNKQDAIVGALQQRYSYIDRCGLGMIHTSCHAYLSCLLQLPEAVAA